MKKQQGGKRTPGPGKTLGRNKGSTKGRIQRTVSLNIENDNWLNNQKRPGVTMSSIIDKALIEYRKKHGL